MNKKLWIAGYFFITLSVLSCIAYMTVKVDPFFHFHKPLTDKYFYSLNNERSQNDGIEKHFEYQGLITGTSMTENFKTSEAESLWGATFIKVPFSGGTMKEINDNLVVALQHNPDLRVIIRSIEMNHFLDDKDRMRTDLGEYPSYLYDNNIFNDVQYVFNRDVVFSRVYPMMIASKEDGFQSGITSFDDYANWMGKYKFGAKTLYPKGVTSQIAGAPVDLPEEMKEVIKENVRENVCALADEYPEVSFYCFIPPYSVKWWQPLVYNGTIYQQVQAEKVLIEEILKHDNIHLFSFNTLTDITTDLNNYKDTWHYGEWVNSMILQYLFDGKCLLTTENYEKYLDKELNYYTSYDYTLINKQTDYNEDYYAAFVLAERTNAVPRTEVLLSSSTVQLSHAKIVDDQYKGRPGVICRGSLQRDYRVKEITAEEYMLNTDYIGFKIEIEDISKTKYITFYGKKLSNHGQPTVCVYDESGTVVAKFSTVYQDIDTEWHLYTLDVSKIQGKVTVIFNGGYIDSTGSSNSQYVFSGVFLY